MGLGIATPPYPDLICTVGRLSGTSLTAPSLTQHAGAGWPRPAGFDEQTGVFRVFDVWESREAWEAFLNDRLMPVVLPMMEQGGRAPETRVYELHEFLS